MKLTRMEKELQAAIKAGNVTYLPKSENKKYQQWAKEQAKDKVISLRINGTDLAFLQMKAAKKGKKYQTYIGEILHREAMKAA